MPVMNSEVHYHPTVSEELISSVLMEHSKTLQYHYRFFFFKKVSNPLASFVLNYKYIV